MNKFWNWKNRKVRRCKKLLLKFTLKYVIITDKTNTKLCR